MLDKGIVIGYLALLIAMGLRGGRAVKSAADFTAAGSGYGTAVLFATLSASYVGGGFSAGNAAAAYAGGIGTTLTLLGFSLSMIAIGRWLVPGVSRFEGVTTVGGIMERAYGRSARLLTGVFSFLCCAGVVGAQMEAMGQVFHTLLGISPRAGILLGCGIVLIYTTFGGLQSVIMADILQFLLLAIGMPLLLFMGLRQAGGVSAVTAALPVAYADPLNGTTAAGFVSMFLTMAVGEALAPPYTQRLLIGRNPRVTARATVLSGLFSVPFFLVTGGIGLVAYALDAGVGALDMTASATVMPRMILQVLPVGLRGAVMASMVSIILSAADGFLNGAAIGLVCDTLLPLKPTLPDRTQLRLLRGINLATGTAAVVLAFVMPTVFDILVFAYSFWCPMILVPLAAAFWGVRSNGRAFRRALLAGAVVTLLWNTVAGCPLGIDGAIAGLCANGLVFTVCTRRYQRHRETRLYVGRG